MTDSDKGANPKPSQGNRGERGGIGIGSVKNRKEAPNKDSNKK